jgi:hypothetical protein
MQVSRTVGLAASKVVPLALFGIMAALWLRMYREHRLSSR